ncbi:MAG: carbohydrate-binding domain-containing protein [Acidimicrobiales bacterium]
MVTSLRFFRPVWAVLLAVATLATIAVTLGPGVGGLRSGDASITVRARGATGTERMEVRVAGTTLASFTVGTDWADHVVPSPSRAGAPDLEVAFVNDSIDPVDRNLHVDSVTFAGVTYQSEAETTRGTGVWENGARCTSGYHRSEQLACNGSFFYGDLPGPDAVIAGPGDEGSVIVVEAAGAVGNELIEVVVDGTPVAVFRVADGGDIGSHPTYDQYRYHHPGELDASRVRVAFINDRYSRYLDHNVRIGRVTLDGTELEVDPASPASPAGLALTGRCRSNVAPTEILACNGYLAFADADDGEADVAPATGPAAPVAPPVAPPTTTPPATTAPGDTGGTTGITLGLPQGPTPPAPTTATPAPAPPPAAGPSPRATGRFYVVGTDIVDPEGNVFYPIGANVAIKFTPYGYVFEGGNGGVNGRLDDLRAWNWNTVRATLVCDNDSGIPSQRELIDGIAPTIEELTSAGVVVILECHDSTGTNPKVNSAKDRAVSTFWDAMAARYRDNPYVWFNIYNEPFASDDTTGWVTLHRTHLERIRAAGAENIVVMDLPLWGQGIHLLAERSFGDDLGRSCNTVFGWHAYGAVAGRQGSLADHERYLRAAQDKGLALIVGEYGVAFPATAGNAGPWAWNITGFDAMSELGPRYGVGLLWWHATGDEVAFSRYALKTDRSGFWTAGNSGNLTTYGRRFWNVSHAVGDRVEPFAGDVADSGCASAR